MSELVAGVLDGLAGLQPGVLYLLAGLFTALETAVGIGLLVPGDSVVLLAGTTVNTPYRFATLVAVTVLGSLTGSGPAGSVGSWGSTAGPRPRRSGPAAAAGRWPRPVSSPSSMRWCRWWPAPSGCPTGG